MKYLTEKRKNKSIEKWEKFISDVKKHKVIGYEDKYYKPCGFCEAQQEYETKHQKHCLDIFCSHCNLSKKRNIKKLSIDDNFYDGVRICRNKDSVVGWAIQCADGSNWEKAEYYGNIVLKAIKKVKVGKNR